MRNFYEPFYAKDGLCSEHPVLMGEVLYHQTVYGHVLVCLDQHPLQEDDLEMVSLLISILEMSLNKREENMDHWNRAMTTCLQQTYQNIVTLIYENAIVTLFGGVKYTTEHPVIFQIRAYDRKHGTEYEKTLRTYVLCMKNREEAAEKLSIHKNTLGYRLSRIMDIKQVCLPGGIVP